MRHLLTQVAQISMAKKNVQKRKARPKRSIAKPGDDHELGLWIDKDLLRKHQNRAPQTIIHDPLTSTNNRYLALADIALGNNKPKKKAKGEAAGAAQP
jgi:hypothetical protein